MRPPNQEPNTKSKERTYEQDNIIWYDVEGKPSILSIDPPPFITVDVCSVCNINVDFGDPIKRCTECSFSTCSACREWKILKEKIYVNPKLGRNKSNISSYKYTAAICPYCKNIMEKIWA